MGSDPHRGEERGSSAGALKEEEGLVEVAAQEGSVDRPRLGEEKPRVELEPGAGSGVQRAAPQALE